MALTSLDRVRSAREETRFLLHHRIAPRGDGERGAVALDNSYWLLVGEEGLEMFFSVGRPNHVTTCPR